MIKNYLGHNSLHKDEYFIGFGLDIEQANSDKEIGLMYGDKLKNIPNRNNRLMCFNYALRNKNLEFVDDSIDYLFEYYDTINFRDVKKGDIVLFRDDANYLHFGRIIKKGDNIGNTIIRAKFGALGIYEHKIIDTPTIYGDIISFWHNRGEL
jgi:hypothetical protein